MKERIADVDVPGWIIGQPSVAELADDLVIMVARSKPGEFVPFIPPNSAEAAIAVLEGSVHVVAGDRATLVGKKFFVLSSGEGRSITPLEHPTRIYCTFFRLGVTGGPAVDSR